MNTNKKFDFIENIMNLLHITDFVYDKHYLRNKSLTNDEKEKFEFKKLNENSIFYSFQTNLMKFLSNFAYKNIFFQEKMRKNPIKFLSLLNHMKIDNCNPFKKEWCVLLVKSLCESNKYKF